KASTGAKVWVARYNGPQSVLDSAASLGVSPDGTRVFVTGTSFGSGSDYDYATVAYDASTGSKLWVARYDGPGNGEDEAAPVGVGPDGASVFVTGFRFGAGRGSGHGS